MDKNAIKKYAVWARRELIARVSQKALRYGITENEIVDAAADSVNGQVLSAAEKKQRQALIAQIREKGFEQVMEEVAYTWFNRFSALRFMEVNGYLPSHVRVFTDDENNFKPQIITEAIHLELDGLDMEKVYALKEADKTEELFKYLLIVQCNALNSILPGMFQRIEDYTELLLPDNLLREGSVVEQMIAMIPEENWQDQVQIIGWLYQFYNIEPKEQVFNRPSGTRVDKEDLPAATQLFTPDWIVRYMVENSLGRLWLEGHPNDELKGNWKYYLDEAEQEPDVKAKLAEIRKEYAGMTPEQIMCIDPCSGSGHILAYLFDVLVQIYESYGYTSREAVANIVEHNIYGLDIDDRAAQLAYFSVMMKARQYDRRFFSRGVQPHVYAIVESNHIDHYTLDYFCNGDAKLTLAMDAIIQELHDAKEYGSILNVTQQDWSALYDRFDEIFDDIHISRDAALRELLPLVRIAEAMAQKYHVAVTNPPYFAISACSEKMADYAKQQYPDSKTDLFAVFIERCNDYVMSGYFQAMITMQSWMFLSSYETLRKKFLQNNIVNMAHLGKHAFEEIGGEVVQTAAFVVRKCNISHYNAHYCRLVAPGNQDGKEALFLAGTDRYFFASEKFNEMPGSPMSYWVSEKFINQFRNPAFTSKFSFKRGIATGNNNMFLRFWHEVDITRSSLRSNGAIWYPYNKGGEFRKWYGNRDYFINWENDGFALKNYYNEKGKLASRPQNVEFNFVPNLSYSSLSSSNLSFREYIGFINDQAGNYFVESAPFDRYVALALLNSCVAQYCITLKNDTLNTTADDFRNIPLPELDNSSEIKELVLECIELCRIDWDSFETSWDFSTHPLVRKDKSFTSISGCYAAWKDCCLTRYNKLKANEEQINSYFLDAYGMNGELNASIEDKYITVRPANLQRDIKSLISYAVGCMFGRYSLDVDGLAFAGGEWDASKYVTFPADKDSIIPICDDEYFADDIVGRFVKFIEVVYGADTLDENLKFIADALGGKGQPKEVIRNYFMNDFYADHCKMYQKRPIYWLFDSGKKNGFKALIYMHRYQPDTIARIRTDYVHEQQARYRTALADLEQRIAGASAGERVKLNKKLKQLQEQAAEIHAYEEKIHHLADQMIRIDLDDGVKKNYELFHEVLAKIK